MSKQYEDKIRKMRNKIAIRIILICLFMIIMSLTCLIIDMNFIILLSIMFVYFFGFLFVLYNLIKIGKFNYFLQEPIHIEKLSDYKIIEKNSSLYIKGIYNDYPTINSVKFNEKEEYVLVITSSGYAMIFRRL